MAIRTVFSFEDNKCKQQDYWCEWFGGFSIQQKQRTVQSLHDSFRSHNKELRVLEISTASSEHLGRSLSAFNLMDSNGNTIETVYQGSKVYKNGESLQRLYGEDSLKAKKFKTRADVGPLVGFKHYDLELPTVPRTLAYNWMWCEALHNNNQHLINELLTYDAFTDIFHSPEKYGPCQAHAASIYVTLVKTGLVLEAMESVNSFAKMIYGVNLQGGK